MENAMENVERTNERKNGADVCVCIAIGAYKAGERAGECTCVALAYNDQESSDRFEYLKRFWKDCESILEFDVWCWFTDKDFLSPEELKTVLPGRYCGNNNYFTCKEYIEQCYDVMEDRIAAAKKGLDNDQQTSIPDIREKLDHIYNQHLDLMQAVHNTIRCISDLYEEITKYDDSFQERIKGLSEEFRKMDENTKKD